MKRCPKCNQEFAEEWLTFCTSDGTPLTEAPRSADYPPPTMAMPPPVTANQEERPTMRMPSEGIYGGPLAMPQQQQPVAPAWQPPPAPFAMAAQPPQQALAITSLVLGLVSLTLGWCCSFGLLTGPAAVGTGIFALVQIKNNPTQYTGKPLAIAGIATGALYMLLWLLIIVIWGIGSVLSGIR